MCAYIVVTYRVYVGNTRGYMRLTLRPTRFRSKKVLFIPFCRVFHPVYGHHSSCGFLKSTSPFSVAVCRPVTAVHCRIRTVNVNGRHVIIIQLIRRRSTPYRHKSQYYNTSTKLPIKAEGLRVNKYYTHNHYNRYYYCCMLYTYTIHAGRVLYAYVYDVMCAEYVSCVRVQVRSFCAKFLSEYQKKKKKKHARIRAIALSRTVSYCGGRVKTRLWGLRGCGNGMKHFQSDVTGTYYYYHTLIHFIAYKREG